MKRDRLIRIIVKNLEEIHYERREPVSDRRSNHNKTCSANDWDLQFICLHIQKF